MDRLDAIQMFMRVVESGSFSSVAREIGIGQPAVSKQVAALEAHLGAQLIKRTSRSLIVTDAGRDFYESAVRLVGDLEAAESRVGRGQVSPSGLVRAIVPPVFGQLHVVPRLPEFFTRYPEITVELLMSNYFFNLIEEGVDVAIHHGDLSDSTMTAKRIATTSVVTVATPAYLEKKGVPKSPNDLDWHSCIAFVPQGAPRPWGFQGKSGNIIHHPKGNFRTNDAEQIRVAVLADLGLAHAPGWLFASDIASGAVRQVLKDYEVENLSISAVRPGGRRLATKVRVFIDFLAETFADEPSLTVR